MEFRAFDLTRDGIPVDYHFTYGKVADVKALDKFLYVLPPESKLYADAGYTDYKREDEYFDKRGIELKVQRKKNSKRPETEEERKRKTQIRKRIETTISDIKKLFPKAIQAVTLRGFLLKINLFILGLQIIKVFN